MEKTFAADLASLVARQSYKAKGNPDAFAEIIERLAAALGFTIALAAEGDAKTIDRMLAGAEAYALSEAIDKAPLIAVAALLRQAQH